MHDPHCRQRRERLGFVNRSAISPGPRQRTVEKKPQMLQHKRRPVDITKKGRFPQMFAPDAVKNVVNPIQKARNPMSRLDTISRLTSYFIATTWMPGVIIGPMLYDDQSCRSCSCVQNLRSGNTRAESQNHHDRFFPSPGPGILEF